MVNVFTNFPKVVCLNTVSLDFIQLLTTAFRKSTRRTSISTKTQCIVYNTVTTNAIFLSHLSLTLSLSTKSITIGFIDCLNLFVIIKKKIIIIITML